MCACPPPLVCLLEGGQIQGGQHPLLPLHASFLSFVVTVRGDWELFLLKME